MGLTVPGRPVPGAPPPPLPVGRRHRNRHRPLGLDLTDQASDFLGHLLELSDRAPYPCGGVVRVPPPPDQARQGRRRRVEGPQETEGVGSEDLAGPLLLLLLRARASASTPNIAPRTLPPSPASRRVQGQRRRGKPQQLRRQLRPASIGARPALLPPSSQALAPLLADPKRGAGAAQQLGRSVDGEGGGGGAGAAPGGGGPRGQDHCGIGPLWQDENK